MTDDNQQKCDNAVRPAMSLSDWQLDLAASLTFLTRLPIPISMGRSPDMARALRAFPLAGAIIGFCGGSICALAMTVGFDTLVAAGLGIAAMVLITGALHEDAVSDVADGFGGGHSIERKLEIMKDSRVGAFGVTALVLILIIKIAALGSLANGLTSTWLIIAVCAAASAWSRALAVSTIATTKNARGEGLARTVGQPARQVHHQTLICGLLLAVPLIWIALGLWATFAAIAGSVAVFWMVRKIAIRQIGGHTGDVAGTVQSLTETSVFTVLTAFV